MQNRRLPEALTALRVAVGLAPPPPACHFALVDALRSGRRLPEAAQEYIAVLKLRPNWLPALMGLATLLHHNDGVVASIPAFKTAVRLAPDWNDYLDDYADALRQTNRWDDAEALLRRRLSAVPADAYAHFLLGTVLMDSKPTPERLNEAEGHLRAALGLSLRNPIVEVQFAELLLDRGQAPEAVPLFSDSLRRLPFERRSILLLSRAYRLIGQNELAAKAAQQAAVLRRDEDQASVLEGDKRKHQRDPAFHQRLADLYDRIGKPEKAAQERLTVQRLQAAPQKSLESSRELEDAVNAVLSPR